MQKKLLVQAMACNLALLMRSLYGAGKPRAASDRTGQLILALLRLMMAFLKPNSLERGAPAPPTNAGQPSTHLSFCLVSVAKTGCLDPGC